MGLQKQIPKLRLMVLTGWLMSQMVGQPAYDTAYSEVDLHQVDNYIYDTEYAYEFPHF